jgi:hypothetical protein
VATFKAEVAAAAEGIKGLKSRIEGEVSEGQINAIARQHFDAISDEDLFADFIADVKKAVSFKEAPAVKE